MRVDGRHAVAPKAAPRAGEDAERVLRDVLGYDASRVAQLRERGALGARE